MHLVIGCFVFAALVSVSIVGCSSPPQTVTQKSVVAAPVDTSKLHYHKPIRITELSSTDKVRSLGMSADSARCQMHGVFLELDTVHIAYGMARDPDGDRMEAQIAPNAMLRVPGGSMYANAAPMFAEVLYCPECRLARRSWKADDQF